MVRFARGLAAGSQAAQIIESAYGLQKTVQPDGSTAYSGTIPPSDPGEIPAGAVTPQITLPIFGPGGTFQLIVGSDGLVSQMSETALGPLTGTWSIDYSQLGNTPSITPPSTYTEGTPADLPTTPWSQAVNPANQAPKQTTTDAGATSG
jgi:hypothetical protein